MKLRNLLLISLFFLTTFGAWAQLQVTSLTIDGRPSPTGIDNPQPRLSWIIQSDQANTTQQSYELRAALTDADVRRGRKLVWNTGKS
jgi:alpha-L-rhamnosidase